MQRKALRYGCITNYDEENQLLNISHKGVDLASITGNGFMHYKNQDLTDPETRDVFVRLLDEVDTVREYVGLYVSAPQMQPKDVQNYRKFTEYGDVVMILINSPFLYFLVQRCMNRFHHVPYLFLLVSFTLI